MVGKAEGAERQLFTYAFHQGIPMVILTDGREWRFFLPAERGDYEERCVYTLDLVARTTEECCRVLERYLGYTQTQTGETLKNARDDYQNVTRKRQIGEALPQAFRALISEQDPKLVDLIAEKVAALCGFKPELDAVVSYLEGHHCSGPPCQEKSGGFL